MTPQIASLCTVEGDSENRDSKDRERKVSSLSWMEGARLSPLLERIRIQRKMSFYLDIDPTTTPPPSPAQQRAGQQWINIYVSKYIYLISIA